jgi:hypothetical protein
VGSMSENMRRVLIAIIAALGLLGVGAGIASAATPVGCSDSGSGATPNILILSGDTGLTKGTVC